jgi:TolB-like protein
LTNVKPSADEIRLQLDRILASDGFANADRMTGFLRYVVERALAGESDQVKEYTIGVAVFGRNEQYDPRLDSIVRVEARRLRTKLDEYYAGIGREDPIVIEMRRGAYVPAFEQRAVTVPASAGPPALDGTPSRTRWTPGWVALAVALFVALPLAVIAWRTGLWTSVGRATPMVTLAVLPFAEYSSAADDALLAARLTDGVTGELARIRTLGVASHTSALQFAGSRRPLREIAQALNAELILEGSVHPEADTVRVEIRLVDATIDRKIWVSDFAGKRTELRDLQRRIAAAAAAAAERSRAR